MNKLRVAQLLAGLFPVLFAAAVLAEPNDDSPEASSPYGLEPIKIKGLDVAFVLPGATLGPYTFTLSSSASNPAEVRNAASNWARLLRTALDKAKDIGKK